MTNDTLEQAVSAYRSGKTADIIQFRVNGTWGAIFTIPPATLDKMARVGDQYRAVGATEMRFIRRARLQNRAGVLRGIVIETLLPGRTQYVIDLDTGDTIHTPYLRDEVLAALEKRIGI